MSDSISDTAASAQASTLKKKHSGSTPSKPAAQVTTSQQGNAKRSGSIVSGPNSLHTGRHLSISGR